MRAFIVAYLTASIIGIQICPAPAAPEGWFVRVCPAKTEANRINLTFAGGRQGFNWSWMRSRTPAEDACDRANLGSAARSALLIDRSS